MNSTSFSPTWSAPARAHRRVAALAAAAALALLAAGCGEEKGKPIPARIATPLASELDELLQRVDNGDCSAAKRGNLKRIDKRMDQLPDDVDPDVRSELERGVDNLNDLVETECREERKPEKTQEEETTPETTPPEQTIPETTPPEETQPEQTEPPDDGGGEGGGGGGGVTPPAPGSGGSGGAKGNKKPKVK
jgi:hypothetical protein